MEIKGSNNYGYTPIETNIYEKLNWDFDLIVLCLEYIRIELPTILKIEEDKIETNLVSFYNFLGQNYPVIGIRDKYSFNDALAIDVIDIHEKIDAWLTNLGDIDNLVQKAKNIQYIDWKTLQQIKEYPKYSLTDLTS